MQRARIVLVVILNITMLISLFELLIFHEYISKRAQELSQVYSITEERDRVLRISKLIQKEVKEQSQQDLMDEVIDELNDVVFSEGSKERNQFRYDLMEKIDQRLQSIIKNSLISELKESKTKLLKTAMQDNVFVEPQFYPPNLCRSTYKILPNEKVLSYSIDKRYDHIAQIIAELAYTKEASMFYNDWSIRIYFDQSSSLIDDSVIKALKNHQKLYFCDVSNLSGYETAINVRRPIWKNIALADTTVDVFCSRDINAPITTREEYAVTSWMNSSRGLHVMRDHSSHNAGINPGLWCYKSKLNRDTAFNYLNNILESAKTLPSLTEGEILNKVIWEKVLDKKHSVMQHDSFHCMTFRYSVPFPTQRQENTEYVGSSSVERMSKNMEKCPIACRPKMHQDWEYC